MASRRSFRSSDRKYPSSGSDRKYASSDLGRKYPSSGSDRKYASSDLGRKYPSNDFGRSFSSSNFSSSFSSSDFSKGFSSSDFSKGFSSSDFSKGFSSSDFSKGFSSGILSKSYPSSDFSRSYPSDDYGKRARYIEPIQSTSNPALTEKVVYIGNLPQGATEVEVLEFMNMLMLTAGLASGTDNPILVHRKSSHSNFGLLEFRSAEEATKSLGLDGVNFMGQNLRLKQLSAKPSTAGVSATASLNQPSRCPGQGDEPVVAASVTQPTRQRVYVRNIPSTLSEVDLRELFKMLFTVAGKPEAEIHTVHMVNDVAVLQVEDDRVADFLELDGANFKGNKVKIGRTMGDYQPPEPVLTPTEPLPSRVAEFGPPSSSFHDPILLPRRTDTSFYDNFSPLPGPDSLNVPSMQPDEFSVSFENRGRLLHVQNLPRGTRLDELKKFLNNEMHKRGLSNAPGTVVVGVASPVIYKYAFVEFRSEEEATNGLELDKVRYRGQTLKVRYMRGYVPPSPPQKKPARTSQATAPANKEEKPSGANGIARSKLTNTNKEKLKQTKMNAVKEVNVGEENLHPKNWIMASWNVQGAVSSEKQSAIDLALKGRHITVTVLQDVRLPPGSLKTKNYSWYVCGDVAVLIWQEVVDCVRDWKPISSTLGIMRLVVNNISFTIVAAQDIPESLQTALSEVPSNWGHIFLISDFKLMLSKKEEKRQKFLDANEITFEAGNKGEALKKIMQDNNLVMITNVNLNALPVDGQIACNCKTYIRNLRSQQPYPKTDSPFQLVFMKVKIAHCDRHPQ